MLRTWMSKNARQIIIDNLNPNDIMLEFGSGGSTLDFSKYVKSYYSLEFNKEWFDKINLLKSDNIIYELCSDKNNYIEFINGFVQFGIDKYDKVLIDGRERVKCAKAILPYIDTESLVFIHDWERKKYHAILEWYNIVDVSKIESYYRPGNESALTVVLRKK